MLLSFGWLSVVKLMRLINRLYDVTLIQIILCFDHHVSGRSIIVGKIIFSIVGD